MRSNHRWEMHNTLENGGALSSLLDMVKWSWSLRMIRRGTPLYLIKTDKLPRPGDIGMVRVEDIGYHRKLVTVKGERLRLHRGDIFSGVFGSRYATDAYEAEVRGVDTLHMLTNAGMIGTVISKMKRFLSPTTLRFMGYLSDGNGAVINTRYEKSLSVAASPTHNIIFVIGTSMNSGKTTTAARLARAFISRNQRVSVCKLTGSISPNDQMEFESVLPDDIRVFYDYGYPSTYLIPKEELFSLFHNMINDAMKIFPDVIIVEIADGILQRETRLLLNNNEIRKFVNGVVVSATCAPSALFAINQLSKMNHDVLGISGIITSKPLCVKEFQSVCPIPVLSSFDTDFDFSKFSFQK